MDEVIKLSEHPLARFVIETLEKANHPNPQAWLGNTQEPVRGNDNYVRIQINNRLRQALGELDARGIRSTIMARACLIPDGGDEEWKELVIKGVIPLLVEHSLPTTRL